MHLLIRKTTYDLLGTKKWGFLTSASFSDFDDLRMGKYGPSDYFKV